MASPPTWRTGSPLGPAPTTRTTAATLAEVLTDEAFARMTALCRRFVSGVEEVIDRHELPWSIVALGARAEYRFAPEPPRTGAESAAAGDAELDEYLHLYLLNRGVLI